MPISSHDWIDRSFTVPIPHATAAMGYVAPLDGIWATAPYFHNGSVPTLAGVLNSSTRPECWTWSYDTSDINQVDVGWNWQTANCHTDLPQSERKWVYDSTQLSYGNQGHTFGDALSDAERLALIEYLKTL